MPTIVKLEGGQFVISKNKQKILKAGFYLLLCTQTLLS